MTITGDAHDLTEQKQAEEHALQCERLAAMGQMLSVLTHESRNVLQLSKANLEMLGLELEDMKSTGTSVAGAQYDLDRVQAAQNRLRRLFEDLRGGLPPQSS